MVGILTFYWADDYGAMLQAYALKHCVERLGEQVEIIPYAPFKLYGRYGLVPILARREGNKTKYFIHAYILRVRLGVMKSFIKRKKRMRQFRVRYLTDRPRIKSVEQLSLRPYSCVFVGSDQVWNPEITIGLDDAYLGNISGKEHCRLVSYGASFGGDAIPEADRPRLLEAIDRNFERISMREKNAADFIGRALHRQVPDVLDPTLLLDREEWERLAQRPQERDYILVSRTEYDAQMMRAIRSLAERLHKKALLVTMPELKPMEREMALRIDGGPIEFIGYLQNAFCVITNSFHGVAFSVLLEKRFLAFRHSSRSARLENLLKKLGLESRLVDGKRPIEPDDVLEEIDWQVVRARLQKERAASEAFIRQSLEDME